MRDALFPIGRRAALGLGGTALVAAAGAVPRLAGPRGEAAKAVTVAEGTNIAIAVSPNGRTIAFDLFGLLWTVPIAGGPARCLSDAFADLGRPCWSPDGQRIVFQSYRSGNFHLWSVRADGSDPQQLTTGFFDHREPCFTPDGRTILCSSDRSGRYAIHALDLASGAMRQLSRGSGQEAEPCVAPDGRSFAYIADNRRLMQAGWDGAAREIAAAATPAGPLISTALHGPAFAPDGALAYISIIDGETELRVGNKPVVTGEDVYPFAAQWLPDGTIVYASSGKIRRLDRATGKTDVIPFTAQAAVTTPVYRRRTRDFTSTAPRPVIGIGSPMLSPDGKQIVFRALNDIYLLTIGNPQPRKLIGGSFHKCDPAWSPDGTRIAYATDRGGTLDIWLHDIATGEDRPLTNLPDSAATACSWSRDGREIVFLDQDGALHIVAVATGEITTIYGPLLAPGRPSFGPDGQRIACAAFKPISARYREGLSEVLVVDRTTGKGRYTPIAPEKSIATRGDDGPVWSPDGRTLAYVFASTLWVQPVDPAGAFTGQPRQLTTETSDAPSWSGDSRTLLYLNNGRLKLVPATGGAARTVPFGLRWAIARQPERRVITGARVWDALSPNYREADVVIEENRVRDLVPRGSVTAPDAVWIDGRGLTLMPGLIDMHTHRQGLGHGGDRTGRAFLAMGITATRSPGCPAYHMVEDREAIDAGQRVAPRHYATGEPLDGGRIFYGFMRPVTEPGQMTLELARAEALGYDLIKTYVRLGHRAQADAIRAAHAMGIGLTSHYHYPALRNGADGVEHLGATSRYGYSRTTTTGGVAYDDVTALFAAAKAGRTPTLFSAAALLPDSPDLVEDPRIRQLFAPWDYARFRDRVASYVAADRAPLFAALQRHVEQIKAMMALGWHVHSGTDAPIDIVAVSLHLNLRGMTRFGISPYEALLTATRHPGDFMGEPIGRISQGQLADLILVEGDPLARVEDAARVRLTIANGVARDWASLAAPFAATAAQNPPSHVHMAHDHMAAADTGPYWERPGYVAASRASCCGGHAVAAV